MNSSFRSGFTKAISLGWLFALVAAGAAIGQKTAPASAVRAAASPRVTKIDQVRYAELIKPGAKPLLINFWATWCVPCREEFPDLVKINDEYKGKIDFITISLDFEEELNTGVPRFLKEMKADMPTYLLVTPDESAAIAMISNEWGGGLPLTVLYSPSGERVFFHQGVVKPAELKTAIDKLILPAAAKGPSPKEQLVVAMDFVKVLNGRRAEAHFYYEKNWKPAREEALKRGVIHSYEMVEASSEDNSDFDFVMITRFENKEQFDAAEKNFEPILKELGPNGPSLLNELKPADFRRNVFFYTGRAVFLGRK